MTSRQADRVFFNGKIITVDPQFAVCNAVATAGERILAVGRDSEMLALAHPAPNASICAANR